MRWGPGQAFGDNVCGSLRCRVGGHTGNQAGWGPDSSAPWTYVVTHLGKVPLLLRYIKRLLNFPIMSMSFVPSYKCPAE